MVRLGYSLKRFMGVVEKESEEDLHNELKSRLKFICKPCWELKYCAYGPLVEDFPLPPLTYGQNEKHINYLKKCIQNNTIGEGDNIAPLTDEKKRWFEKVLENEDVSNYVEQVSYFEREASCKEFGHLCPAFFVSEPFTETTEGRRRSRKIPNSIIIRVARRDNNTCQICGKILLDREIEIDHIIPYSKGGSSDENNLRVTCFDCNRKKGNKVEL